MKHECHCEDCEGEKFSEIAQKVSLSSSQNWSHVMSYVNKALATPDLTESSAKNVVFANFVQLPFFPMKRSCLTLYPKEHMMLVTRLKCAGGLADLMTRKSVKMEITFSDFGYYTILEIIFY